MKIAAIIIAALIILGVIYSYAFAHGDAEWIMRGNYRAATGELCCGPTDCAAVPAGEVETVRYGYIWHGHFVRSRDALPSTDGQFWACTKPDGVRCFFAPLMG